MKLHPVWFYLFWGASALLVFREWRSERLRELEIREKAVENYDWGFDKSMKLIDECRSALGECHAYVSTCYALRLDEEH